MTRQICGMLDPFSVTSTTSNTLPKIDVLEYSTNIAHAVIIVLYLHMPASRLEWIETIIHSQVLDVYFIK